MSLYRLKERIEFVKRTPANELIENHLKEVFTLYHKMYGEVCTGCPNKIAGYIKRIKNFKQSKIMSNEKSNFKLKKGAILPKPGTSEVYSNENLTDEVAIRFIKKNPNRKQLFAVLPKNLDELLEEGETQDLNELTVKQLKAKYPDASGRTKADLIADIEASIEGGKVENPNPELPEEEE